MTAVAGRGAAAVARDGFGAGPLSRAAALVHTLLTVEAMLLAAASPGLAGVFLLGTAPSNLPLLALCLVPLGPALSAALYALHRRGRELTELRPARTYWRGWRLNAGAVLRLWVPLLAWLTVIGFSLTHFPAAGVPNWWAGLLVVIGAVSLLWGGHALVLGSLFAFRSQDVARLAAYFLLHRPKASLATASLLVLAGGLTLLGTEALAALLAAPLLLSLLHGFRSVIAETREEFTA
ncbi:hypothetical protein [Streptomyces endophyticus]|uniref:DUF624 domain-containing protein n=1 Tax=Streptomyces endophyticus TaxID=714166 RepID=A0ABU6FBE1_9ACTN|nr:hypothetical protein [Streptomyces endophyticus]MEB8341345.1 hypothetical protein [Streptomyces endophyticus]